MKYYITADVCGFYTGFHEALNKARYFNANEAKNSKELGKKKSKTRCY